MFLLFNILYIINKLFTATARKRACKEALSEHCLCSAMLGYVSWREGLLSKKDAYFYRLTLFF